MPTPTYSFRN